MDINEIIADARSAPSKISLETYVEAITVLRDKGYTWRDIADFLSERGVNTDHTKVYRFMKKQLPKENRVVIPKAKDYKNALETITITDVQRTMLEEHYKSHNRTVTYSQLARAAGKTSYRFANTHYGRLGTNIGIALGFNFQDSERHEGGFKSSSIGMDLPKDFRSSENEYELVMHHELAKAIEELGWFSENIAVEG